MAIALWSSLNLTMLAEPMAQVNDFQVAVDRFAHAPYLRNASVGVCVMDIDSGAVLASNTPDLAITTASTMKTVTSASALALSQSLRSARVPRTSR